ncbi:hypothetical protein CRUP_018026 [Coryphaenoides rupestris]|nr:hypothetical protein CRUP_018026 [Coryphaenoides rupestris]
MCNCSVFLAAGCLMLLASLGSGSLIVNSNAIKSLVPGPAGTPLLHGGAGHAAGSSPDDFGLLDGGNHNLLIDPIQALSCAADAECGEHEFCYGSRGACLPCKRRRKRCARDAMCCPGNQCSNGVCLPMDVDIVQQFTVEEMEPSASHGASTHGASNHGASNHGASNHGASSHGASSHGASNHGASSHGTNSPGANSSHMDNRRDEQNSTTQPSATQDPHALATRGREVSAVGRLLRGPVLRSTLLVCTKHRKKGALGLEIFQRCDCGVGLACRTQRGAEEHRMHKAARTLHTCQQH